MILADQNPLYLAIQLSHKNKILEKEKKKTDTFEDLLEIVTITRLIQ